MVQNGDQKGLLCHYTIISWRIVIQNIDSYGTSNALRRGSLLSSQHDEKMVILDGPYVEVAFVRVITEFRCWGTNYLFI